MFVFGRRVVPIVLLSAATLFSTSSPARSQASDPPMQFRAVDLGLPDGEDVSVFAMNRRGQIAAVTGTSPSPGVTTTRCWLYANGQWTWLGSLGGQQCRPAAMNDRGQIVGSATTADGVTHPFIYADGHMTDIGALSGKAMDPGFAFAINSFGVVVGQSRSPNGLMHAFRYENGGLEDIDPTSLSSTAFAINDAGQIAGVRQVLGVNQTAYRYANGERQDISVPGAHSSVGRLISKTGDVAGTFNVLFDDGLSSEQHAFLLTAEGVLDLGATFVPNAMNDGAQIAGAVNVSATAQHAVVVRNREVVDLGSLGSPLNDSSVARSINASGHVVGQTATAEGTTAFFSTGVGLQDLRELLTPESAAPITDALLINDVDQIVATGVVAGRIHSFLLSPPAVATELSVAPLTVRYGTPLELSATLTSSSGPVAQKIVTFAIDGVSVGSGMTDETGAARLTVSGQTTSTGDHIVSAAFAGDVDYSSSSGTAALQVGKAHARLVIAGGTFPYDGQPHPATVTATGVLGEPLTERLSISYAGSASGAAPVAAGTYSATVEFSGDSNYEADTASADITVLKAPLRVTASDAQKLLGAPNPAFTASYSGFIPGESAAVLTGTLTFATPATSTSPVGTYPITPSGLSSPNYDITYANGTLSITYKLCIRFDQTRAVRAGSTIPIRLDLCTVSGISASSPSVVLKTATLRKVSAAASTDVQDSGDANPDLDFRYLSPGYIFNLKTTGLTTGTWDLVFSVTGDPLEHDVTFQVR
jgi:probable HAF family extracellular repeat protein